MTNNSGGRPRVDDVGRASLQQVNEMIRFADMKAAAVLAVAGVLASQLWIVRSVWDATDAIPIRCLVVLAGSCAFLSVLLALHTLAPRQQETASGSLYFYHHVASRFAGDREGFVEAWLEAAADGEATNRAIAGQIWAANMVAHRKFVRMTWSIRVLLIGVIAMASAVVL